MKNLKNNGNIFQELSDLLMQSVAVSGSDDIVKDIYMCEQYPDKVSDSSKLEILSSLKYLALSNKKAYKDNKNEVRIWSEILDKLR